VDPGFDLAACRSADPSCFDLSDSKQGVGRSMAGFMNCGAPEKIIRDLRPVLVQRFREIGPGERSAGTAGTAAHLSHKSLDIRTGAAGGKQSQTPQ
jgi:hypothetical protein